MVMAEMREMDEMAKGGEDGEDGEDAEDAERWGKIQENRDNQTAGNRPFMRFTFFHFHNLKRACCGGGAQNMQSEVKRVCFKPSCG